MTALPLSMEKQVGAALSCFVTAACLQGPGDRKLNLSLANVP